MNRRDFLKTASGVTGTAAVAGAAPPAVAQEDDGNETSSGNETVGNESGGNETDGNETGGGGGGGGTKTVAVVDNEFQPAEVYVKPGTTVVWEWEGDGHNVVVDSQPDDANWEGHEPIENSGFTYEHTFETTGEYAYYCSPHQSLGMEGTVIVNEQGQDPSAGGGGGGGGEVDIHQLGVPIQAHFVGLATILMILVSLVFTFYVLKYGESPNASSPNRK
ncbi:twin-arginine translocation signal domain-containing protein [Halostella sp. JP-L12]|uniref:plastocyanin/azurin family copper-binding protein n=1 Tax=Halostella TaxID=1843185 RepID=UPI000EF7F60D|nr:MULTISPECIES: plastocyanin/azurin family copper-binding protein [Halostella]NHN47367.1 twin-arginine translocation signal domain-containing protein [Halostella sp. JP-L12]